jgi:hypothetical protein
MTYKDWSKRPDLIEELASVIGSDIFQAALSVLIEEQLPKTTLRSDSPNLMENHALLNAKREGYFDFLRNLRLLAVKKPEVVREAIAPWGHVAEQD